MTGVYSVDDKKLLESIKADAAKAVVKTKGTYAPAGDDYTEAYARYERTDATLNV